MTKPRLVISIPGPSEPGFLRRQRAYLAAVRSYQDDPQNPATVDVLADMLATFVREPADPAEARDLLFELSQDEINGLLEQLAGKADSPAVTSSGRSTALSASKARRRAGH